MPKRPKKTAPNKKDPTERFAELLLRDKGRNLLERIAHFRSQDPEGFARSLGFADLVYRNHWVVIPIVGEGFAFSVGMNYEYAQPEIMVLCDSLSHRQFQQLINEVCCRVRDQGPVELGRDYTDEILRKRELSLKTGSDGRIIASDGEPFMLVDAGKPLVFSAYTDAIADRYPCGYLQNFNLVFGDRLDADVIVVDWRDAGRVY